MKKGKVKNMKKTGSFILATALLLSTVVATQAQDKVSRKSPLTPAKQQEWRKVLADYNYMEIAKAYADYMIEYGRDRYGKVHSPLFVTVMDRKSGKTFRPSYAHVITKPFAPGLRRDHKMRPYDRTYFGSNPLQDLALYRLLYRLSELTGENRYGEEADKSIAWFLDNGWSSATKLPAWGTHMYYDVGKDMAIFSSHDNPNHGYGGHEYNWPWPYWDQNPKALNRFAHSLWNECINNKETGHFSRHSNEDTVGMEFPQTGSCFMENWAREYGRSGEPEMKKYIQTLLKLYRSMRDPATGAMSWCTKDEPIRRGLSSVQSNLSMASNLQDAAGHVEKRDPKLAEELREFVRFIDDEYLSNDYDYILDVAGKGTLVWYTVAEQRAWLGITPAPEGVDTSVGFPIKTAEGQPAASLYYLTPWFPGRSYARFGIQLKNRHLRCEAKHKPTYRRAIIDIADIYMSIGPEVQFVQYPDNITNVVKLLRFVYKITDNVAYLHRADQMMRLGIRLFFDDTSPLPKITNFDDWYESSENNGSSVEILRQMLELSGDLKALPKAKRITPQVVAEKRSGLWQVKPDDSRSDMIIKYGPEKQHELYLSQAKSPNTRHISLSDTITRIPTAAEADKINGRMKKFTGKRERTSSIAYGGFKDVPRQVELVIRNVGRKAARVRVEAILHDTYHDNGQVQSEKVLDPGRQKSFTLTAPAKKWIRRLSVTSENKSSDLRLEQFMFNVSPRSKLQAE